MLSEEQYKKLPIIFKEIVKTDRKIGKLLAPKILPISVAHELTVFVNDRKEYAKAAKNLYGSGGNSSTGGRRAHG